MYKPLFGIHSYHLLAPDSHQQSPFEDFAVGRFQHLPSKLDIWVVMIMCCPDILKRQGTEKALCAWLSRIVLGMSWQEKREEALESKSCEALCIYCLRRN